MRRAAMSWGACLLLFATLLLEPTNAFAPTTYLDTVSTFPASSTCFCQTDAAGACPAPPTGCTTGHLMMFKVRGPGWSTSREVPPVVNVNPLWYDYQDPDPDLASCESATLSYDGQIVACLLRAPTSGVFNFTITGNLFEEYGFVVHVVGPRLTGWVPGVPGCVQRSPQPGAGWTDRYMCSHASWVTFSAIGVEGMRGAYWPEEELQGRDGLPWVQSSNNNVSSCEKLIITATQVKCLISSKSLGTASLKLYFQMKRQDVPSINGVRGNVLWEVFNISRPIMVDTIFPEGGWGQNNTQQGTPWSGGTAIGTGFDNNNGTNHTITFDAHPPYIQSITGDCVAGQGGPKAPPDSPPWGWYTGEAHLTYEFLQYGLENYTENYQPAYKFQHTTVAHGCSNGGIITIKGAGFSKQGTIIRFTNTSEPEGEGEGPTCYVTEVKSVMEVECQLLFPTDLPTGSNANRGNQRYSLHIDSIVNYQTPYAISVSTNLFTTVPPLYADFAPVTFTGIEGCVSSTNAMQGWGCTTLKTVTITGSGFFARMGKAHKLVLYDNTTSYNPLFTITCLEATTTSFTCVIPLAAYFPGIGYPKVGVYIHDAYYSTALSFSPFLPPVLKDRHSSNGVSALGAASAVATCANCEVPRLYAFGGTDQLGSANSMVREFNPSSAYPDYGTGWTTKAAMPTKRAGAAAAAVTSNHSTSPDNRYVYTFGGSTASFVPPAEFEIETPHVNYTHDHQTQWEKSVISVSADSQIMCWVSLASVTVVSIPLQKVILEFNSTVALNEGAFPVSAQMSADASLLFVSWYATTTRFWELYDLALANGTRLIDTGVHPNPIISVAISDDNRYMAYTTDSGYEIQDRTTGVTTNYPNPGLGTNVRTIAIARDSSFLFVCGSGGNVGCLASEITTGEVLYTISLVTNSDLYGLTISGDGKWIALEYATDSSSPGGDTDIIALYPYGQGKPVWAATGAPSSPTRSRSLSIPDDNSCVVYSATTPEGLKSMVVAFDFETGTRVYESIGRDAAISFAVTPDGKTMISAPGPLRFMRFAPTGYTVHWDEYTGLPGAPLECQADALFITSEAECERAARSLFVQTAYAEDRVLPDAPADTRTGGGCFIYFPDGATQATYYWNPSPSNFTLPFSYPVCHKDRKTNYLGYDDHRPPAYTNRKGDALETILVEVGPSGAPVEAPGVTFCSGKFREALFNTVSVDAERTFTVTVDHSSGRTMVTVLGDNAWTQNLILVCKGYKTAPCYTAPAVGAVVSRGIDWSGGDEDGGPQNYGKITAVTKKIINLQPTEFLDLNPSADFEQAMEIMAVPSQTSYEVTVQWDFDGSLGTYVFSNHSSIYEIKIDFCAVEENKEEASPYTSQEADRSTYLYDTHTDEWTQLADVPATGNTQHLNVSGKGAWRSYPVQFFDVVVHQDVVVTGMDIYIYNTTEYQTWELYYKSGTWEGAELDESQWTYISSASFTPAAVGKMRYPGDFPPLELRANSLSGTYAFYLFCDQGGGYRTPNFYSEVPPGSPEMTIYTGYVAFDKWVFDRQPWFMQEFQGAIIHMPTPNRCVSMSTKHDRDHGEAYRFVVPVDADISEIDFTIQANMTNSTDGSFANIYIKIKSPEGKTTYVFQDNQGSGGTWPADTSGWVRFTTDSKWPSPSASASPYPGSLEQFRASSYAKPMTFYAESLAQLFSQKPRVKFDDYRFLYDDMEENDEVSNTTGYWEVTMEATADEYFHVLQMELRVCHSQPGLVSPASATVGQKVVVTGGLRTGDFMYAAPHQGYRAQIGDVVEVPIKVDPFDVISELTVGIQVEGANAETLKTTVVAPPLKVGSALVGQWYADGTRYDVSDNSRHGTEGPDVNRTGFVMAYPENPDFDGYKVYSGYPGYNMVDFWGRPTAYETRTAWIRIGDVVPGKNYEVDDMQRMTIAAYGNRIKPGIAYSTFYLQGGAIKYSERTGVPEIDEAFCDLQVDAGLYDAAWHHVALTRESGRVRLYVDGVLANTTWCTYRAPDVDDFTIGELWRNRNFFDRFYGMIFDVRQYETNLAPGDIAALYAAGVGGQRIQISSAETTTYEPFPLTWQMYSHYSVQAATVLPNKVRRASDSARIGNTRGIMYAVTSASGGRWILRVEVDCNPGAVSQSNQPTCTNATSITWAIKAKGTQEPGRGTAVMDGWSNTWNQEKTIGPMSVPRYGHALAVVDGTVYAIGGANSINTHKTRPLGNMDVMHFYHDRPTWRLADATMRSPVFAPAVAVKGNEIWVLGGSNSLTGPMSTIQVYDTLTLSWSYPETKMENGHTGGYYGVLNERLFIGGGMTKSPGDFVAYLGPDDAWKERRDLADARYAAVLGNQTEFIDLSKKQPKWARMPGYQLISHGCAAENYDTSTGWAADGAYSFGVTASQAACAAKCGALARSAVPCGVYEWNTGTGACYGRIALGHTCGVALGSSYKSGVLMADHNEQIALQTTFNPIVGAHRFNVFQFDIIVGGTQDESMGVLLTGISLNLLVGKSQKIWIWYKAGTHVGAMAQSEWTSLVSGLQMTPGGIGRYYLPFGFETELAVGTHALLFSYEIPGSIAHTTVTSGGMDVPVPLSVGDIVAQDLYIKIRAGTYASVLANHMTFPRDTPFGLAIPSMAIHYNRTKVQMTTRNLCLEPYDGPVELSSSDRVIPYETEGFAIFASVEFKSVHSQQGLIHKAAPGAHVEDSGGFAVSLVDGGLHIKSPARPFVLQTKPFCDTWQAPLSELDCNYASSIGVAWKYKSRDVIVAESSSLPSGCYVQWDAVQNTGTWHYNPYPYNNNMSAYFNPTLFSICQSSGWVPIGPTLEEGSVHSLEIKYEPSRSHQWTLKLDDKRYVEYVEVAYESGDEYPFFVGSEGGQRPWMGAIRWVTIDCAGPEVYNYQPFHPSNGSLSVNAIQADDDPRLSIKFDRPIAVGYGNYHLTTSVHGGLNDGEVIDTELVNISAGGGWPAAQVSVTNAAALGTVHMAWSPHNFSYDVRYQVSADVGLVHSLDDAGVWQGLEYVPSQEADFVFYVSGNYIRDECVGRACATCNACHYQGVRVNGDRWYLCYVQTERGEIEVTRLNVDLLPTHDCP